MSVDSGRLLSLGSANRASAFASAAIQALISVDYVLAVLLGDSTYGAFIDASAATQSFISIDLVCHW
jgi:hypothetical protein